MNEDASFRYLNAVTTLAVGLIILNVLLGMRIPFRAEFLAVYVAALLGFVVWHSVLRRGWRRTALLMAGSITLAFIAEALGVNFGLVFGRYHYSDVLGVKLLGVPLLAALAWEPILYASLSITHLLLPSPDGNGTPFLRRLPVYLCASVAGALATTAWDMMIDPIAVSQGWWVWEEGGDYLPYVANGVPITNFLGWLGVSFTILLLERIFLERGVKESAANPYSYAQMILYASLFLTSFGVTVTILRRPEAALVGVLAMGPFLALALTNAVFLRQNLHASQPAESISRLSEETLQ